MWVAPFSFSVQVFSNVFVYRQLFTVCCIMRRLFSHLSKRRREEREKKKTDWLLWQRSTSPHKVVIFNINNSNIELILFTSFGRRVCLFFNLQKNRTISIVENFIKSSATPLYSLIIFLLFEFRNLLVRFLFQPLKLLLLSTYNVTFILFNLFNRYNWLFLFRKRKKSIFFSFSFSPFQMK